MLTTATDILTYTIIPFVVFGAMSVALYAWFGIVGLLAQLAKGVEVKFTGEKSQRSLKEDCDR